MRRRATIKIMETESIQTRVPQLEEKGDNKESGNRDYTNQGYRRRKRRRTIKRAKSVAIQIKGTVQEEEGRQ